jgi:glycerol-3-phosphate dehydrogenase (NAD(P)+)
MNMRAKKITVLGDGGWGTALSILLAKKGVSVNLWSAFPENADDINKNKENTRFLSGFSLPENIIAMSDIREAVSNAATIVVAIPSHFLRRSIKKIKQVDFSGRLILSVVKGIENDTFKRPSEIIKQELGVPAVAVLSGPTIANEVARGLPAGCVIACEDTAAAKRLQAVFITERFRVYTSGDVAGVELGGALKNIIAIASGISDGLALGSNAKAALFTRGLVEMKRLAIFMGADPETLNGLSGIGDLVTTCISPYSRNRRVGQDIARGKRLPDILNNMEMVAEGVETSRSVYSISRKNGIDMPINEQVYEVLFKGKDPRATIMELMLRESKPE